MSLDDILVVRRTVQEHLDNLREFLQGLQAAGLELKAKKCSFIQQEVGYLEHIVSSNGVSVDSKKTAAIQEFPWRVDLKSLQSFVGLASYYRWFVLWFSHIAGPFYALTKKDTPFEWTVDCMSASL